MLPIITIIGRTNVGKSTLFNVFTKKRNALVANIPNLTRDRNYGICYLNKTKKIIVIDTAGFDFELKKIKKKTYEQTLIAIQESNIILFVVSARDGLVPQEYEISKEIRKYGKKIILVINKIDGLKKTERINEFSLLGFKDNIKISSSHNQGINNLIEKHLTPWIESIYNTLNLKKVTKQYSNQENQSIKIACIGKPNSGKSTLINSLAKEKRIITSSLPGTTIDNISIPINYNNQNYIFIDTAGITQKRKKNKKIEEISIIKTLNTIEKANVILLIIDAKINISNQDLTLINFVENKNKPLIIIINKYDLLNFQEKKIIKDLVKNQLKNCIFTKIHFISALYNKGLFDIFKSINNIFQFIQKKIKTSFLMKIMHSAIQKHQPPIVHRRRIKLKYAHLGSSNLKKIIIHGNQVKHLSLSYKKYLKNFFYNALKNYFKINGIPLKIDFKEIKNPYKNN